ncbi:TnsA-like heteromeric transposase endonuclease subunit [Kibdelosporangium philippinense]
MILRLVFVDERSAGMLTGGTAMLEPSRTSCRSAVRVMFCLCLRLLIVVWRDGRRMRQVRSMPVGVASVRSESDLLVRYRGSDGGFVDTSLDRLSVDDVLAGLPVREFRSYRGRRHYSGWYWSATTGGLVVYESRLELARILLADKDSDVVAIAAQPFLVDGFDGERTRRHVPDVLLGHADRAVTVVDVKAASRLDDPKVSAQFAWMKRLCEQQGFRFEVWSGTDPVLLENVRFLAGFRRPALVAQELVPLVLEAAVSPCTIAELERQLAGPARWDRIRPVILHLLWRSRLTANLFRPLDGDTIVRTGVAA